MNISDEKIAKVKSMFKHNPLINTLHICSDNFAFTNADKAAGHAGTLKDSKVDVCERADFEEGTQVDPILDGNLEELETSLKEVTEISKLEGLKVQETTGKGRSGALKLIDERIEALGATSQDQ